MYTSIDFKTKKAVKMAILQGIKVTVYNPGPFGEPPLNGTVFLEGPHYPKPHTWYGQGTLKDGKLIAIK